MAVPSLGPYSRCILFLKYEFVVNHLNRCWIFFILDSIFIFHSSDLYNLVLFFFFFIFHLISWSVYRPRKKSTNDSELFPSKLLLCNPRISAYQKRHFVYIYLFCIYLSSQLWSDAIFSQITLFPIHFTYRQCYFITIPFFRISSCCLYSATSSLSFLSEQWI